MRYRLTTLYTIASMVIIANCIPTATLATIDPNVQIDIKKTIQEIYQAPSITADTTIQQHSTSPSYEYVLDTKNTDDTYGLPDYTSKKIGNKKTDITYALHTEKDAKTDASRMVASISTKADTGENATIEIEARMVADAIYLNLKKLDFAHTGSSAQEAAAYSDLLEGIINQWINIPVSTAVKRSDTSLQKKGVGGLIQEDLTSDQKIALLHTLLDSKAVVVKQIPDSTVATAHVRITIVKRHIPTLVNKISPILGESALTGAEKKALRKALLKFKPPTIDLWINTSTHLPEKMAVQGVWNSLKQNTYSDRLSGSRGSYTVETVWSNWGNKVHIAPPSSSKTLEQILSQLFASSNTIMNTTSLDAQRIVDIRQLQTALELYYADQNHYPTATQPIILGELYTQCLNAIGFGTDGCVLPYISTVPRDPGTHAYIYQSSGDAAYTLTATLDANIGNLKAGTITATPNGLQN